MNEQQRGRTVETTSTAFFLDAVPNGAQMRDGARGPAERALLPPLKTPIPTNPRSSSDDDPSINGVNLVVYDSWN